MKAGSKEAKAWGRKMKRLRGAKKTKRKKTRKYTTRKRREKQNLKVVGIGKKIYYNWFSGCGRSRLVSLKT
jgi:hypothetical protein